MTTTPIPKTIDTMLICPVTGLPVISQPEWTDRPFGADYRLTTRVIGNRILLNQPSGYAELKDIVESLALTDTIVSEHIDQSVGYVHISDYSGMRGITREARKHYTRHMERREHMLGLIYFSVSPLFRVMIKLAKRLSIVKFNVQIAKDYSEAVSAAIRMTGMDAASTPPGESAHRLRDAGVTEHYEKGHHILRCDRWRLKLDGYSLTVEVIDRRIYHALSSGILRACHVEPVARLRDLVRHMIGLERGFSAIVTGTADAHTTDRKARKQYMASLKDWHQQYPMTLYIFYNANRFIRTAAMLAIPFMPFKVKVARDLANALDLVDRFAGSLAPTVSNGPPPAETVVEDPVHVVHQLLQFIGDIDWERPGSPIFDRVDQTHPFRPVFDAIALIKGELDGLFDERGKAEKALRESQQRFDEVLKHSRDILFKRDLRTGAYEYVSEVITELLGVSPEAICRMGFTEVQSMVHPEDLPRFMAFNKNLMETADTATVDHVIEYRLRDSQGRYHWFSDSRAIVRNEGGKPVFIIGSNRDITGIKALESERQEIAEQLRHTRKLEAVNTMAGGVAHNFNNLLMVVLGNLELMRMDAQAGSSLRRKIDAAEKSAQRAADLSTLMLTYVGQTQISPQTVDLNIILSEMVDELKTTVAEKATLILAPVDSAAWIYADASKVCQVITNLVTNAVEASSGQPLEVHLSVGSQHCDNDQLFRIAPGERLAEGRYVWLRVSDNGQGMDQETLEKVFDPFFTTKFTGRGLGMAAVMGIMRAHRGGVRIDSRPGAGTSVTVYFPERKQAAPALSPSQGTPAARQSRGTALLVDDEPLVLELGKQMLVILGFDVLTAVDGFEALTVFEANRDRIRMVVLDIHMPRMGGRETLERLHGLDASLPVLVTSGFIEAQAREKLEGLQVAGYIKKPFRLDQLQEKIDTIFSSSAR